MGQQDYDFFATGRPAPPAPPLPDAASTSPAPPAAAAPVPRTHQFTDPGGRAVNQFGTPIDVSAVPAGPAAAPGYGAEAFTGHGLTEAHWTPPAAVRPPGAHAGADRRPGQVLAAGIIAIVQGALALVVALLGLAAVAAVENGLGGGSTDAVLVAQVSGFVRLILVLVLLVAALYLTAGIATAAGKRWGAWTLVVVEGIGLLLGLIGLVDSDAQSGGAFGQLVGLAVPVAVLVLLLLPVSRAWLQRR